MAEQIILVDEHDVAIRPIDKLEAHRGDAFLHRALSVFIFNARGEMLLQLRSPRKYHFGGLWSNACCSHPHWGEGLDDAAHRCLRAECGFDTPLEKLFSFVYRASWQGGIGEHEFDHVFAGRWDGDVPGNPEEAEAWRWMGCDAVRAELDERPGGFTPWFRLAFDRVAASWDGAERRSSYLTPGFPPG